MKIELKPCPFCGGVATTREILGDHHVICMDCRAWTDLASTEKKAVELWNRRVKE